MTQDKFVQLMVESGLARYVQVEKTCVSNALQRFAALVAAHEREKQAKQEPVAWRWSESNGERWFDWRTDWTKHDEALRLGFKVEYAYAAPQPLKQESVAIDELARACNLAGIEYKDFLRIKAHLPIAAPVQQVDLTDDEIEKLMLQFDMDDDVCFARAVIAAYKEKNK